MAARAPIPLGYDQAANLWVVVGVSGFSRVIGAWMIPSRQAHDVLGGHLQVLHQFGALPRTVVWDQESAIGAWRGRVMAFTVEFQAFRGTLGIGAVLCQRGDPEAKGLVERANEYLETSFLPGRCLDDVADFNRQLTGWLVKANCRIHATTKVRPREAMAEDRGAMLAFPAVLPDPSLRWSIRLPRDHYVRVDTNDYSVNPPLRGPAHPRTRRPRQRGRHLRGHRGGPSPAVPGRHQSILAPDHARAPRAMRTEAAAPRRAHQAWALSASRHRRGRLHPFEAEAANLFFQLVASRYERASVIVTSNKQFGRWSEVFGDAVVAAAMIDRLVHHASVVSLKGDSYRLKDRDLGRVPTDDGT